MLVPELLAVIKLFVSDTGVVLQRDASNSCEMGPKGFPQKVSTFKLFVSNLPNGLKNEDVARLFEPYGRVVESEVFKGNFAFVHMEDDCNGRQAIQELNGKDMDGNVLSVVQSKNIQGPKIPTMKLAVKNLPAGLAAGELRNLFTKYGYILEAEIRGPQGHVLLEATGDIRSAINEVNGHEIGGQVLKVEAVTSSMNNNSTPSKPKPGKRKEPMPGPYGRQPGPPPAYMPPPPPPPPYGNFGAYPRRPGPAPGPPRLGMRPGPGPRPFFRPPPPPPQQEFSQDYDYNCDNDGGSSGGFYGDNYEQPYLEQHPRRPPHRNFMQNNFNDSYKSYEHDNQPYFSGNTRRNFPPPNVRIPRERPGPLPPPRAEPVYNEDSYFTQDDYPSSRNINEYEEEFETPSFGPPGKRLPPPLMGGADVHQSEPHLQALLKRTAKVTKYGKIVVNGIESPVKKKRGVRGGVQVRARKNKQGLPSLMDPIPGTVTPAGGQPYTTGYNPTTKPVGPAPPLMGLNNPMSSGPKQPRPLMHFQQQRPAAARIPAAPTMMPLMRPPRSPAPPQKPGSKQSLLALYHESKRQPPQHQQPSRMMMPVVTPKPKQDIDFTADIEIA
ncbi:unnamed protein product [Allacma fusca]|uniref:RRM domain-containing protein n=1 Tax=Allacma fusca TaxID=39272 RepID=A0A8J2K7S6_9HEXA|nr:unnamed protein product [Allacma fusca]